MTGIIGYGVYVPQYRIKQSDVAMPWGGFGMGEKAVCGWDEDIISMAAEAIDNAVKQAGIKPADVGVQLSLAEVQKAAAAPGDDTPADFVATMRTVLKLDPANVHALYYVGLAEERAGHPGQARALWNKALAVTSADDPLAIAIRNRLNAGKTKPH